MALAHGERHRWIKEISEINRKINQAQGGGAAPAATVAPARPAPKPMSQGPGGFGGLGMTNMLAPHLQQGKG